MVTQRIIPKKDTLYACKLGKLGFLYGCYDDEDNEYTFGCEDNIAGNLISGQSIEDIYTLLKYEGNGRFKEFYSQENVLMHVSYLTSEEKPKNGVFAHFGDHILFSAKDFEQFEKKLNIFKKIPLGVDPANLCEVNSTILKSIQANYDLGDSIRNYIESLKSESLENLDNALEIEKSR